MCYCPHISKKSVNSENCSREISTPRLNFIEKAKRDFCNQDSISHGNHIYPLHMREKREVVCIYFTVY